MEGVVRSPSAFSNTFATPPSNTATHELVVPKSIPMILPISLSPKIVLKSVYTLWGYYFGFQHFVAKNLHKTVIMFAS